MKLEILDTTLRDGEQTSGVAFSAEEKLTITKLLITELKVDRVEIASARVSEGEFKACSKIMAWAKKNKVEEKIEFLGFVDGNKSVDWIVGTGGKVINLLTKGSYKHVTEQLRKTPEEHITDITEVVEYAVAKGCKVNVYLEDWSNGMRNSPEYVFQMVEAMAQLPIERFLLPDTLGILNPVETYEYCVEMKEEFPDLKFDFHPHNDFDFATANVFSAVRAGITGIHTTINGLGERAGNVPLSSVIAISEVHLNAKLNLDVSKIHLVSKMVETFSGIRIPANKPVIGENVFTQTSGVHADGDNKSNLYHNKLVPEKFGRVRTYALGKTSGKANIEQNLKELGIKLDKESMKKVTQRVVELGDKKENVTKEDLPYIISDVLRTGEVEQKIEIVNYSLSSVNGLKPVATIKVSIDGSIYEDTSSGDGQYDCFMKALWKIYNKLGKDHPILTDYIVTIPPGGKTDALVESTIKWEYNGNEFKTRGLDSDQTVAAIKATQKMLNIIETLNK